MTESVAPFAISLPLALLAVAVFWALGAYNRLMRLRAGLLLSFANLSSTLRRQLQPLQASLAVRAQQASANERPASAPDPYWAALDGALIQFVAALEAAGNAPLRRATMLALQTGEQVLELAWQRLGDACAQAGAEGGATGLAECRLQWEQLRLFSSVAHAAFTHAVAQYNQAIAQFPASLLAWIFGFEPACPLQNG
jgi:LemA protein